MDQVETTERISFRDVSFHPHSFADPRGRLFDWEGGIYRGLLSQWVPHFRQLLQDGIIQRAVELGLLIETEPTAFALEGYGLVLRHRRIPFVSYPNEWSPAMYKDACLTLLDLSIELAQCGFTIGDANPWNLLFDDCHPVFVDLSSIVHIDDPVWPVYNKFCRYCLYPLKLMSEGQELIARLLMCEDNGVLESDLLQLTGGSARVPHPKASLPSRLMAVLRRQVPQAYREQIKNGLRALPTGVERGLEGRESATDLPQKIRHKSHIEFLKEVRREVEAISFASPTTPGLTGQGDSFPPLTEPKAWTPNQLEVHQVFRTLRPSTVLDVGGHTGWYAKLAARLGSRVVRFDTDSARVTQLYREASAENLAVLPLIMDFSKPTPARGLANHWSIAATERLQCEMVLALGVIPDLVQRRHLWFEQIVEGVALFARRWAVVEYVGREDAEVSQWWREDFSWYTLENLTQALRQKFSSVRLLGSGTAPRALLLCEK